MDSKEKHCIINAYVNDGWYPRGQERLVKSLNYHGYSGDVLTWKEEWPMEEYDTTCPYNIKAACLEKALELGYTTILWLDCSCWAIKDVMPIFDKITHEGYYMWGSGYFASQTCNDAVLEYFGVTRDEVDKFPDCSSSMFGLRVGNPIADEFAKKFIQAAKDGMFKGSREHNPEESSDPRFMFSRHDQSVATILAYKLGMTYSTYGEYSCVYEPTMPKEACVTMKGL